jgi:DNA polymerase
MRDKKEVLQILKDQRDIFGDELFIPKHKSSFTSKLATKTEKDEPELFPQEKENWENSSSLDELEKLICNCTKCNLHKGRNKFVFGSGNPNAKVLVIGEGPGAEEDKQGLPFVGRAGQLLTDMLRAIDFSREEVYIGNIIKCRPPENRTPFPDEIETCLPYLKKQIDLIKPNLILCLGLTAAKGLLGTRESMTNLRGKLFEFENAKVMVTYHPAALLRNPHWKRPCWEDLKMFKKLYDSPREI